MTPLPTALGGVDLLGWRLDKEVYSSTWDSGIGAERFGGRWNNKGTRVVYAALDPSTAILEVAVHRSEEHTSEFQSLMRISYAVFCLKKKKYYQPLPYHRPPVHKKTR